MPEPTGGLGGQPLFSKQISRQLRDMIAFGAVRNWYYVGVRCHNDEVGTTTEDLWGAGGVMVWPSAAGVASVVSTDVADTSAGTGALTVKISGLDEDYLEISETITMNGTTPVNSTLSYLRVNSAYAATAGTGEVNAGNITVSVGGNVQRYIAALAGICHCGQYTVPAGYTAYLTKVTTWQGKDSAADVVFSWKTITSNVWKSLTKILTYRNQTSIDFDGSIRLAEKTDIRIQATAATGTCDQSAQYALYLWSNE